MNKAWELNQRIEKCLETYTTEKVEPYFRSLITGDSRDVEYYRETHDAISYPKGIYRYLACAVKVLKPKTIVEIGADKGVSALAMASELPKGGKIYSLDMRNGWEHVPPSVKNIIKLHGDSRDLSLYGNLALDTVDLWFIDGEHSDKIVRSEIETYSPYWREGTVLLFDDIDLYYGIWSDIKHDRYESREIHGQNFGVVVI